MTSPCLLWAVGPWEDRRGKRLRRGGGDAEQNKVKWRQSKSDKRREERRVKESKKK